MVQHNAQNYLAFCIRLVLHYIIIKNKKNEIITYKRHHYL